MVDRTVLTTRMNISVVMYITSVDCQLKIHSFTILLLYNTITVLSRVDVYILCSISFGGGVQIENGINGFFRVCSVMKLTQCTKFI